jgi:oligopeptide transport system ATP-binding protein
VLVEVQDLKKHFPVTQGILFRRAVGQVKAVDGVSFTIRKGEALGLVGESGCGKSTIARCLLKLLAPTSGRVRFAGADLESLDRQGTTRFRRRVQAIFQDPYSSLNPRMKVREIVGEPLYVHGLETGTGLARRVDRLLDHCGLPRRLAERYPHSTSRSRPRSSTCSTTCAGSSGSPTCSSATISASCGICATASR